MTKLEKTWISKTCKLHTFCAPRWAQTHETTLVHLGPQNQDSDHRRVPKWLLGHRNYPPQQSFGPKHRILRDPEDSRGLSKDRVKL